MRLFVAAWPPRPVVAELEAAVAGIRDAAPGLRWTAPEQWHLTLAFLGEVADARRPDLERRLARAAARHPPLDVRFAGGGRFGNRVLVATLDGDRQGLRRLAASAAAAARRAGVAVEERPYRPHLTLARAGTGGGSASDLRPLVAHLAVFEGTTWTVGGLDLVESRLGQGPGRRAAYDSVASWPLQGSLRAQSPRAMRSGDDDAPPEPGQRPAGR
jgi:2'-5' RNA ligase